MPQSGNIAVFGPPGAGKSTTVERLRQLGYLTLDLEQYSTSAERKAAASALSRFPSSAPFIIGAADTSPADYSDDTLTVLILPPAPTYYERRRLRDAMRPAKSAQPDVYPMFEKDRSSFDMVLYGFEDVLRLLTN